MVKTALVLEQVPLTFIEEVLDVNDENESS